jgi:benzoyl-CoA reductase/2-hydroxyglutaryl-CoA dehydratase subunit BcrC/BadD/HgdB
MQFAQYQNSGEENAATNQESSAASDQEATVNGFETLAEEVEISVVESDLIRFLRTGIVAPRPWTTTEDIALADKEGVPQAERLSEQEQYSEAVKNLSVKLLEWIEAQKVQAA